MNKYAAEDYTFDALCLDDVGVGVDTLAYLVGLVTSETHPAGHPDTARYSILYPLSDSEEQVGSPGDLLSMQAGFLPNNYLPQTPVMFARRWSPISELLKKGYGPVTLARDVESSSTAVASGIWRPEMTGETKRFHECTTDEELFWAIMSEVASRAKQRGWLINVIADVGWSYDAQVGSLQDWSEEEVAQAGRVLWKRTVDG